jgi:hypothetical protein
MTFLVVLVTLPLMKFLVVLVVLVTLPLMKFLVVLVTPTLPLMTFLVVLVIPTPYSYRVATKYVLSYLHS